MDATGLGACLQHRLIAGIRPHLGIKNIEYLVTIAHVYSKVLLRNKTEPSDASAPKLSFRPEGRWYGSKSTKPSILWKTSE